MVLTRGFVPAVDRAFLGDSAHFDWYSATLDETVSGGDAADHLEAADLGSRARTAGRRGYAVRDEFYAGTRLVLAVSHGGAHDRPLVEASGPTSGQVADLVRRMWPEHRVTRVDSAIDWDAPDAWAELSGTALQVARGSGIKTSVAGDWLGKEDGRTLYVGGRTASVRLRVYEKGLQLPEAGKPDWVRAEVQFRPEKAQKAACASLSASAVWGASRWSGKLWEAFTGLEVPVLKMSRWQAPDDLRARNALLKQYGKTVAAWRDEYGSWAEWVKVFGELVDSGEPLF